MAKLYSSIHDSDCHDSHQTGAAVLRACVDMGDGALQLENFEAAIADATAVLVAIAESVVTDAKQARDLHFKAVYRWVNACVCSSF